MCVFWFGIHYTVYTIQSIHYTEYTLYSIHYTVYTIQSIHYTVYTIQSIHYTIQSIQYTVIIAKVREVRENIKRNRFIWRIIQLWCFHHYHIVISHNTI